MKRRRPIPLGVKLKVALAALGYESGDVEWDHEPPLALRRWDEAVGDYDPPQHDPRFIQILTVSAHARKTNGTKATTAGSDKHRIAHTKRLVAKWHPEAPKPKAKPKRKWPKRRLQSRGFGK